MLKNISVTDIATLITALGVFFTAIAQIVSNMKQNRMKDQLTTVAHQTDGVVSILKDVTLKAQDQTAAAVKATAVVSEHAAETAANVKVATEAVQSGDQATAQAVDRLNETAQGKAATPTKPAVPGKPVV